MCKICRCYCNKSRIAKERDCYDICMEELKKMVNMGAILLDVRSPQEYNEGHIDGAILFPEYEMSHLICKILKRKEKDVIIVYCSSGIRSKRVRQKLEILGYQNVYNLYNGFQNY